ncbi:MAG: GAF domain-containing protein [Chloroflexota bacterium]
MTVARKLLMPTILLFAAVLIGLVSYFSTYQIRSAQLEQERQLERLSQALQAQLMNMEELAIGMATQTSQNPQIQSALANKEGQLLVETSLPAYLRMKELYDIPVFDFYTPDSALFLSPAQPDLTREATDVIRINILAANTQFRNVSGIELSPQGLLVVGIVPMRYQNQHIGCVEYGLRADKTLLSRLKAQYGADWQILLSARAIQAARLQLGVGNQPGPLPELLLQASTMTSPTYGAAEAYQQALSGEATASQVTAQEPPANLAFFSVPLRDFAGSTLGVVDIVIDRSDVARQLRNQVIVSISLGLAGLALGGTALVLITRQILRPVQELTLAAGQIAQGDLSRSLPATQRRIPDEISQLTASFASMTHQLRAQVGTLEENIAQRTQELQRRSLQLEVAADAARQITTLTDPDTLLEQAVDLIRQRFGLYHASVFLVDDRRQYAVIRAAAGPAGEELVSQGFRLRVGQVGMVGSVTSSGEARIASDVGLDAVYFKNPLLPETRSEMTLPLRSGEVIIGALDVQSTQEAAFGPEDITVLQVIADQLAIAIQNARLIQQLNRSVADLEQASGRFTRQAWQAHVAQAQSGQRPIGYRYQLSAVQPIYIPLGAQGSALPPEAQEALRRGETTLYASHRTSLEPQAGGQQASPRQATNAERANLAVPIKLRDQVIGVLHLKLDADSVPDETRSLVEEAASRLALVLESTRLLSQAQQRAQREQLAAEVTSRMRASLDMNTVLQTAVREIAERLGLEQAEVHFIAEQPVDANPGDNHPRDDHPKDEVSGGQPL